MDPLQIAGAITAGTAAAAGLGWAGRTLWRIGKRVGDLTDDWRGEPARAGVDPRPGVMERLQALETGLTAVTKELHPNGGSSMRDALDRLETKLGEHIASHGQPQPVQVNVGVPPPPSSPQKGD